MRHLFIASLLLVGCHALDESGGEGFVLGPPPDTVAFENSFIVTDHKTMKALEPDFHIGALLYAENHYLQAHEDFVFARAAFEVAADDVDHHNSYGGLKVGTVPTIVNTFRETILPAYHPNKNTEPFHLIAVINRLDLAGDFDMRGGNVFAGARRRWFGEGRLVYAVDGTLKDGTPYPMTFIMEYRLPALKTTANGIVPDDTFDFDKGPTSEQDWTDRRQLWAQVWQDLSAQQLGSPKYIAKLQDIASWFAYGTPFSQHEGSTNARNHLAIRSGENVQDPETGVPTGEFEYREYYLNGQTMFSTRKLRREPFACSNSSNTFVQRIQAEWIDKDKDLAWNYMLGERDLDDTELADLKSACNGQLPYGQADDDDAPVTDTSKVEYQFRAKFSRFTPPGVWSLGKLDDEAKIHAFAVGTCSGCHSGETGTGGFQISPPADGAEAGLSDFLRGQVKIKPRTTHYSYDERGRRMDLVSAFANGKTVDDPLLRDMGCVDLDVCKIK